VIPEFIGRLPVIATLGGAETRRADGILTSRATRRQAYRKLLEMDGVQLKFTEGALRAVSPPGHPRTRTAPRGLRAHLENAS